MRKEFDMIDSGVNETGFLKAVFP